MKKIIFTYNYSIYTKKGKKMIMWLIKLLLKFKSEAEKIDELEKEIDEIEKNNKKRMQNEKERY